MPESVDAKIMAYMRGHWPSDVRPEWRVRDEEYAGLVERVVNDWTEEADRERKFLRLAGQSGSGKTTQLLPIAEEMMPRSVLVAARKFVQYHPYVTEIENEYGKENLRRKTDEFSTIMMFLTLKMLIEKGFNIILDVTLLDVAVESVLVNLLKKENYDARMMMVALAREISDELLLFSATMPKEIAGIAKRYMHDAEEISVGTRNAGADSVEHV